MNDPNERITCSRTSKTTSTTTTHSYKLCSQNHVCHPLMAQIHWIGCFRRNNFLNSLTQQRLTYIPFYMQGPALARFKWLHSNHQLTTWEAFTYTLECRFGPSTYENHQVTLFKLKQVGLVMEYQSQFEMLANRVVNLSPKA